jgi:hypothetical protein
VYKINVSDRDFDPKNLKVEIGSKLRFQVEKTSVKKYLITVGDEESNILKAGDCFDTGRLYKSVRFEC